VTGIGLFVWEFEGPQQPETALDQKCAITSPNISP